MKRKKVYEHPATAVTRVVLESPICDGSTNFVGEEASGVNIEAQAVTEAGHLDGVESNRYLNDFSGTSWGDGIGGNK